MTSFIYRGISYDRPSNSDKYLLSPYTAKYRGCSYNIAAAVEVKSASSSKLIYRGCHL